MAADLSIGLRRELVTPEGVALRLTLGDGGSRVAAFLLDLGILLAFQIALSLLIGFGLAGSAMQAELLGAVWLIGTFVVRNFYFILMELGPRGATFGKRALGLRVVARGGESLTADAIIARNLIRELEFYLPLTFLIIQAVADDADGLLALLGLGWTLLFLAFPLFNRDYLRVGDLLAGTWVIAVPRPALAPDAARSSGQSPRFSASQLAVYGVHELHTLEQVLRADEPDQLTIAAAAIRRKIGAPDHGNDREFLDAYYAALRTRLERELLFGKRQADKHAASQGPGAG